MSSLGRGAKTPAKVSFLLTSPHSQAERYFLLIALLSSFLAFPTSFFAKPIHLLLRYFSKLNDRIFGKVYSVARSDDKQLTTDDMISMGLDPKADKEFLLLLLQTYAIDATLVVKDPCCPV